MDKDTKKIVKEAQRQGWRFDESGRHPKLWPPDKTKTAVIVAGTPGDRRARQNLIAEMRRRGFRWPPEK